MTKKKTTPPLKDFQLSMKVVAYYEVNIKAENFHDAVEKAKNVDGYKMLTTMVPMDSSTPELWAVIDPSI